MVYCCVPFCTENSKKKAGKSFHEFPVDENRRNQWLKVISRQDGKGKTAKPWQWTDTSRVCSQHFRSSDYKEGLKNRCLKPHAVPSVFPHYPSYMQPKPKKYRRSLVRNTTVQRGKRKLFKSPVDSEQAGANFTDSECKLITLESGGNADNSSGCELPEPKPQSCAISVRSTRDASTVTKLTFAKMKTTYVKYRTLQRKCQRLTHVLKRQEAELEELRCQNMQYQKKISNLHIDVLEDGCIKGEVGAKFLKGQVLIYTAKKDHDGVPQP